LRSLLQGRQPDRRLRLCSAALQFGSIWSMWGWSSAMKGGAPVSSAQNVEGGGGPGSRKLHPLVIVAIVLVVVFFVLPVLAIVAISFLGTAAETEFSNVGSQIG
jgi:ABC-type Fe3+ transport system permease subunit